MKENFNFSVITTQNNISTELKEVIVPNKEYVYYGTDNKFPSYLLELYSNCSTLTSIIDGTVDYISGNGIKTENQFLNGTINSKGDTLSELLRKISFDYLIFGGFAIQIIRNVKGEITELIWLDFSKIRVNEDETNIFYSNEWGKSKAKAKMYPSFDTNSPTSIFYYKGEKTRGVYPIPTYNSAIMSIETQIEIKKFHKTSIKNNFTSNLLINFNNGIPTDEEKKILERKIEDKFTGSDNAGKFLISWNEDKDKQTEILRLESDNFDEKYQALNKSSISDIFTSFRATPMLFGTPMENIGFNSQEYKESFELYNRVSISPIQHLLERVVKKITKFDFVFIPFTLIEGGN